jgi:hypothetical protein
MRTTCSWKKSVIAIAAILALNGNVDNAFVSFQGAVAFTPPRSIVSTTTRGNHPRLSREEFHLDTFQGFQEPSVNDATMANDEVQVEGMFRLGLDQDITFGGK